MLFPPKFGLGLKTFRENLDVSTNIKTKSQMTYFRTTTLSAVLAIARAIELQTETELIPSFSLPSFDIGIPSLGGIMDIPVLGDGLGYIGDGVNIVQDGINTGLDYTLDGLGYVADETVDLIGDIPVVGGTLVDIGEFGLDVAEFGYDVVSIPFDTLEGLTGIPLTPSSMLEYTWNGDFVDDFVGTVDWVTSGDFIGDTIMAPVDFVNYVSDGGNWEAMGKTLLIGGGALLSGDPEGAAEVWGNKDLYTEDFWDELDRKKREAEDNYNDYKQSCKDLHVEYLASIEDGYSTYLQSAEELYETYT